MDDEHGRKPLGQHNRVDAHSQPALASGYAELVAEANELLELVQNIRPAQSEVKQRKLDEEKAQRKLAPKTTQLTVVRVKVWFTLTGLSWNDSARPAHCTCAAQVAGRTFGVPVQLAERIAVYTENETKQQQLDRQCQAYRQQRRLKEQGRALCTEHIDHVLLNKAAIVIPAVPVDNLPGNQPDYLQASIACNLLVYHCHVQCHCMAKQTGSSCEQCA